MLSFLKKNKYPVFLTLVVGTLMLLNYQAGTFLSGWDNLQTELNPGLAVKRAFFSVWEEYQSFGLTAGMAHAADLIRASLLYLPSKLLPLNMVRYFYHFLMLLVGSIGTFKLLGLYKFGQANSTLGALFYMLNLGTLQMFFLPFEPFSAFFAFLPWAVWSFITVLKSTEYPDSDRKKWLTFLTINILGTPSFYTQQIFVVYILFLGCFVINQLIQTGLRSKKTVKDIVLALSLVVIINSFWILPQVYFLKNNREWVSMAKINQLSTEHTYYQNLEKGNISDFTFLEGYYLETRSSQDRPLFWPWINHFSSFFKITQYFFAFLMLVGLLDVMFRKKYELVLFFVICSIALLLATPPFSWVNTLIRNSTLVNQIFRSPFTKFIIPYALIYSILLVYGLNLLISGIGKIKVKKLFLLLSFGLLFCYSLPSFQGHLISSDMKVKIPQDYFKALDFFKTVDKNSRITLLPDFTFWGWFFHRWGYKGSGFLWYGIEQPIVSRTFDVWNPSSESYFWEHKRILEAEDVTNLEKLYEKYNITYLLVDYSLIPISSNYKSLQYDRIDALLKKSRKISPVFIGKELGIYKFTADQPSKNFVGISSELINAGPERKIITHDRAYEELGQFKTDDRAKYSLYYPFTDLTTQTRLDNKEWSIREEKGRFVLSAKLDARLSGQDYKFDLEPRYQALLYKNDRAETFQTDLSHALENNSLNVKLAKVLLESSDLADLNYNSEIGFSYPNLSQKYSYLVKIKTTNSKGLPLAFYIVDETKEQPVIEDNLRGGAEYFILPPKFAYGLGYSIVFRRPEFKNIPSKNTIEEVSVYLFPYDILKSAKLVAADYKPSTASFYDRFDSQKINYFTYQVSLNTLTADTRNLILFQSYDPGWLAIANGSLLSHFEINNWANGWRIDRERINSNSNKNSNITLLFWPQYLQFFGLILLIWSIYLISRIKN